MSNGYKKALQRFEDAVRAHAWKGTLLAGEHDAVDREYAEAKRALVQKLAYRSLSRDPEATRMPPVHAS
jgi:hypothetical protein